MGNFSNLVTSSVLARALALLILFLTLLSGILIYTIDLLEGKDIPQIVSIVVGTGLGIAGTFAGINFGVVLQPIPNKMQEGSQVNTK